MHTTLKQHLLDTTAVKVESGCESDTRDHDVGKEENCHSTEDTIRNRGNDTSNLSKDSHEDQPASASDTGSPGSAFGLSVQQRRLMSKQRLRLWQDSIRFRRRLLLLTKAMTPLFWLNVVLGMDVNSPERIEQIASDMRPPWTLLVCSGVSNSS